MHFWDRWHEENSERFELGKSPFPLAKEFMPFLLKYRASTVLDLACGKGNDALYFARERREVYALDISSTALEILRDASDKLGLNNIHVCQTDLASGIPFGDRTFSAVYSHLGLHYFDNPTTRFIFSEIARVLQSGGLLTFNVKSTRDFRYGEGVRLDTDTYEADGHVRHFFDKKYAAELLVGWTVLLLEEYETQIAGSPGTSSFIKVIATFGKNE